MFLVYYHDVEIDHPVINGSTEKVSNAFEH